MALTSEARHENWSQESKAHAVAMHCVDMLASRAAGCSSGPCWKGREEARNGSGTNGTPLVLRISGICSGIQWHCPLVRARPQGSCTLPGRCPQFLARCGQGARLNRGLEAFGHLEPLHARSAVALSRQIGQKALMLRAIRHPSHTSSGVHHQCVAETLAFFCAHVAFIGVPQVCPQLVRKVQKPARSLTCALPWRTAKETPSKRHFQTDSEGWQIDRPNDVCRGLKLDPHAALTKAQNKHHRHQHLRAA